METHSDTLFWKELHKELQMSVKEAQPCSQVCVTCDRPFRNLHCTKCNTCYEKKNDKLVLQPMACPCCSEELAFDKVDVRIRHCLSCKSEWTLRFDPHTTTIDLVDSVNSVRWCYSIPQPETCLQCNTDCYDKTGSKSVREFLKRVFPQQSQTCYSWVSMLDRSSALLLFETAGLEGNVEVLKLAHSIRQFSVAPPPAELLRSIFLNAVEREDGKVLIQLRNFKLHQELLRDAFVLAAEHKSLSMMRFLRSRFALDIEDMVHDYHKPLLHCVKNKDMTGFLWLKKKAGYTVEELSQILNKGEFVHHVQPCFLDDMYKCDTLDWEAFLYHNKVKETQEFLMANHFPTLHKQLQDIVGKAQMWDRPRKPSADPTAVDDWLHSFIAHLTKSIDLLKWALNHSTLKDGHCRNSTLKDDTYQKELFALAVFEAEVDLLDFITDYFQLDSSHFLNNWYLWPIETVDWVLKKFDPVRTIACELAKDTTPKVAKLVFDGYDWITPEHECVYIWYDRFPDCDFYRDACHGSMEFLDWLMETHPDSYQEWLQVRTTSLLLPIWLDKVLNQDKDSLKHLHQVCPLTKSDIVQLCEAAHPREFKFLYKLYTLGTDDFSDTVKIETVDKFLFLDNICYLQWLQDQWQMPESTFTDKLEIYSPEEECWFQFNFSLRQRIQACLPLNNDFWSARFVCTGVIILKNAASAGDLEVAQWAIKAFTLGNNLQRITQMERNQIMLAAMKNENVQLLQHLYNFLELQPEHVEDYLPFCSGPQACAWLHSVVHYFKESSTVKNTWETAKVFKRQPVLQWIQDVFHYQDTASESPREQLKKDLVDGRVILNEQVVNSLPQFQEVCKLITETDPDSFLGVALVCYFRAKFVVSQ